MTFGFGEKRCRKNLPLCGRTNPMPEWSVKFASGWHADAPPDVQSVVAMHTGHDKTAVISTSSAAHLTGALSVGDLMFYGDSNERDAIGRVFEYLANFLRQTDHESYDVSTLIFVNFKSDASPFESIPPESADYGEIHSGLGRFARSVAGSLHVSGIHSTCDWAALSVHKIG